MKSQTRPTWLLTRTQKSFPSPFAEVPCWCQPWGSRGQVRSALGEGLVDSRISALGNGGKVSSGWQGPPKTQGAGGDRSTEGVHSGCSAGCGWDSGGPGQPVVCGLQAATGTTNSEGWRGGPAASPCWGALPRTRLMVWLPSVSEAVAPRLLHMETRLVTPVRVASPSLVCEACEGLELSHPSSFTPTSQDLEDLEEAEEPDLEEEDDQKAVKDEL